MFIWSLFTDGDKVSQNQFRDIEVRMSIKDRTKWNDQDDVSIFVLFKVYFKYNVCGKSDEIHNYP